MLLKGTALNQPQLPPDILATAGAIAERLGFETGGAVRAIIARTMVALAILAERERCAKTAEVRANLYGTEGNMACREVASSIRAGETA